MADTVKNRPDAKWDVPGHKRIALKEPPEKPAAYTMRVFLTAGPYTYEEEELSEDEYYPWRDILISADDSLQDLHLAIFDAFDRFDEHLYEFNLSRGPRERTLTFTPDPDCGMEDEEQYDVDVMLHGLELQLGRRFGYWFDFGDDWYHVIEVREIHEKKPKGKLPKVVAKQGKSPPQYPDYDE